MPLASGSSHRDSWLERLREAKTAAFSWQPRVAMRTRTCSRRQSRPHSSSSPTRSPHGVLLGMPTPELRPESSSRMALLASLSTSPAAHA